MVNDTYSDIISNAGSIYKYTIYLHNPHFTTPVRSPVRTLRFSSQNNPTTKFYIAGADSAPPTTPHVPMSLTLTRPRRRRGSNSAHVISCYRCIVTMIISCTVSHIARNWSKIAKFIYPTCFQHSRRNFANMFSSDGQNCYINIARHRKINKKLCYRREVVRCSVYL